MASDCEMELCPNWSGDGWSCPCAVLGLDRPVFDLDPPEPERCEADYSGASASATAAMTVRRLSEETSHDLTRT